MLQSLTEVRDELHAWTSSGIVRVPTGYKLVDRPTLGGPAPGELMLFIARTGVGKTWWALNVLANNPDTPAVFFELEMHARYVLKRLAAVYTGTPTKSIEMSLRNEGYSPAVDKTVETFSKLEIVDQPGLGIPDMVQACKDYAEKHGEAPRLVIVDYVELVRSFGTTETESVKRLMAGLKDMAREVDAVVLALHQAGRGAAIKRRGEEQAYTDEGHRPLSKGSAMHGGEASADYMVGAFRPGLDPSLPHFRRQELANDIRLQFLKTRGDEEIDPRPVQHFWDQPTGRILELDWEKERKPRW